MAMIFGVASGWAAKRPLQVVGDEGIEPGVRGTIHGAHAAFAEPGDDAVRGYGLRARPPILMHPPGSPVHPIQ